MHKEQIRDNQRDRSPRKPQNKIMKTVKSLSKWDSFWGVFEKKCEEHLSQFNTSEAGSLDADYDAFLSLLDKSLNEAVSIVKPTPATLNARLRSTPRINELRIQRNRLITRILKKEFNTASRLVNRQLQRAIRFEKDKFRQEQVREIETLNKRDCKRMWRELKKMAGWRLKEQIPESVLNKQGQEVSGDEALTVWKEEFEVLGKEDLKDDNFDAAFGAKVLKKLEDEAKQAMPPHELDHPISADEILEALREMQPGKAEGIDEVVSELLMRGGSGMLHALTELCQKAWEKEEIPDVWTKGIICPIHKDGDKKQTRNYRGITLLSNVVKIYTYVLNRRLLGWCERNQVLVEEQAGFRPRRGCPDQHFSLVEILKNRGKKGTFCCFLDIRKAFDRVFRAVLWHLLFVQGLDGKMWRVLRNLSSKVESCVRVKGNLSSWFRLDTGVRQGCVLSPVLYALFINGLVRKLQSSKLGVPLNASQTLECLLYADDIVLLAENKTKLQALLDLVAD